MKAESLSYQDMVDMLDGLADTGKLERLDEMFVGEVVQVAALKIELNAIEKRRIKLLYRKYYVQDRLPESREGCNERATDQRSDVADQGAVPAL